MKQPLIDDLSDKKQVKQAEIKLKLGRDLELSDIAFVLSTLEGRRFVWRLLSRCQVFRAEYENSARIHFDAGQRNLGLFIMAEISEANENLLFKMMSENKEGLFNG